LFIALTTPYIDLYTIVNALENRYSPVFKQAALPLVQKTLPPLLNRVHYTR